MENEIKLTFLAGVQVDNEIFFQHGIGMDYLSTIQ